MVIEKKSTLNFNRPESTPGHQFTRFSISCLRIFVFSIQVGDPLANNPYSQRKSVNTSVFKVQKKNKNKNKGFKTFFFKTCNQRQSMNRTHSAFAVNCLTMHDL